MLFFRYAAPYPLSPLTKPTKPFNSFFKTLTNQTVTIELKNDIRVRGTLKSVDQYLNIKLDDVDVLDLDKYPHLSSVKNMFIRGSVVRYVVLPRSEVDVGLLEDATRRGELFPFVYSLCWRLGSGMGSRSGVGCLGIAWKLTYANNCLQRRRIKRVRRGRFLNRRSIE